MSSHPTTTTHPFTISFTDAVTEPGWNFGHSTFRPELCHVAINDKIAFKFEYMGMLPASTIVSPVLVVAPLPSPFVEGNIICLKEHPTVTIGTKKGEWQFCLVFGVRSPEGNIRFHYLPDPELQVGST
ncbi:hypothetical protein IV454_18995 [Massilia antarctica]|uniref:Uncharacterized protein n=1 Tax=Massilia antarctica TaxID=2765360 RepID=A0AA49A6I0_9BURK|nr:hypothetical protein [Massilia antarctica]QPI47672.1 hypothetical protein IV454_18995 [Massilia antarctica]